MTLAGYVALSHVRVPTVHRTIDHITSLFHAEQMEAFANNDQAIRQFVEEHRRETGEDLDPLKFKEDLTGGSVVVAQKSKGWTLLQMFRMMETIHELIFRMHWTFMIASNEDGGFLTSDNPVSLYDPVGGPRGAIGFASTPAAYFMFPLSRKLCLVGRHWKGSEVIKLTPFEVRRINTGAIARSDQQVYAPFWSNKIQKIVDNAVSHKPAPRRVLIRKGHIVEE